MAYSLDNIFIESNFEVEDIYDVSFSIRPNVHSLLNIVCSVKEGENILDIIRNIRGNALKLRTYDGKRKLLFSGTVKHCKVISDNKINTLI